LSGAKRAREALRSLKRVRIRRPRKKARGAR
jgi:hypothetical protein